LNLIEGN